uniref:Odorant receptor n=1 Tax=Chouioia cunea TaxID=1570515 RepID=A0A6B9CJN8_9HYME|nr:odorant receptor 80 [Chouioia cunea]
MLIQRKDLFGWSAFFHRAIGLWPEDDQFLGVYWWIKSYFVIFVTVGGLIFHLSSVANRKDNLNLTEFVLEALVAALAIAKSVPIVVNRTNVLKILSMTLEFNLTSKETLNEKHISDGWFKLQNRLIKFFIRSYTLVTVLYFLIPWLTNQTNVFPLKGYMPDYLYTTPGFQIVYFIEVIVYIIRFIGAVSCDLYCTTFICQLFSELQIVQYKLTTLKKCRQSLIRIIQQHAKVLDHGYMISKNFSIVFLLQHVLLSMIVCFSGLNALYTDSLAVIVKMLSFLSLALVECFFICLIGEQIKEESLKVANNLEDIYDECLDDLVIRKLINFVHLRAQKPLELKFGKYTVINLQFYCETLKTIFSLSTVFKTMIK